MIKKDYVFFSESVIEGHPDKLCDQISDSLVDRFLQQDPYSSIIAETAVSQSIVFLAVQFASTAIVDAPSVAREVINEIGYQDESFSGRSCTALTSLRELPLDEENRFDENNLTNEEIEKIYVRNQVNVFGFACNQTKSLMPLPIWLAHKIARRLNFVRKSKILNYLTPDAKIQVGVEYQKGVPKRIHSITLQICLKKNSKIVNMLDDIRENVIKDVFWGSDPEQVCPDEKTKLFVRPNDPIIGCGPNVHSGLTGRKNAIDTYGEYARHSGASLSGKDPRRIDRIGAYIARYAAKNIVAAGLAEECEVQLSYSIGFSRPVSIFVQTFGTGKVADDELTEILKRHFEFRPAGILKEFNLRHMPLTSKGGFYKKLASYGHMGRIDLDLPWEKLDKLDILAQFLP